MLYLCVVMENYKIKQKTINSKDEDEFLLYLLRLTYILQSRDLWPSVQEEKILVLMLKMKNVYKMKDYNEAIVESLFMSKSALYFWRRSLREKGWLDEDGLLSKRLSGLKSILENAQEEELSFLTPFNLVGKTKQISIHAEEEYTI